MGTRRFFLAGLHWWGVIVWVYIRCCGNGFLWFRPYGGSLLRSAKVSKTLLPHHSVPRLGSACPHSGIAPWAAAKGHPWPSAAIPASMPGCPLRNACVRPSWLTGRPRSKAGRGGLTAGLVLPEAPSPNVGASLLAMASDQPILKLADTPLSRASSLPQRLPVTGRMAMPACARSCGRSRR